ncbi:hypothetical protein GCM10023235_76580 [Kitasatospora terrestris]|uniref:Uncharacterized protein n=1 Tax=Kitasatospora terrestris TaxID=258051 RepID=A0ABP9EPR1_9ACTN
MKKTTTGRTPAEKAATGKQAVVSAQAQIHRAAGPTDRQVPAALQPDSLHGDQVDVVDAAEQWHECWNDAGDTVREALSWERSAHTQ